jgi:hypothetical protein
LRFFAGGFFVAFGLARGFFMPGFRPPFRFAARFFAPVFRAPLRLTARELNSAQRAAERLDFALVVVLLVFGELDEFQNFFHLFERLFEGFNDMADFVCGFGHGRKILLMARFIGRWPFRASRVNGPLLGSLLYGRRFGRVFLGCRCGWFVRGGYRGRGMD